MSEPVIVIGAGVIGAAIAHRLAGAGSDVTVIDAGLAAGAASGRSFGWINASFHLDEHHFHLRLAGMEAHRRLAAELGPMGPQWPGALSWEEGGAAQEKMAEGLRALGYPVRLIGRDEIARLEPALRAVPEAALVLPSEGVCDLAVMTRALLSRAAAHGARLCLGVPVREIVTRGGRVAGVAVEGGVIAAQRVVVAAGTGAEDLLRPLGQALPMLRRPAVILRSAPIDARLNHILVTPGMELRQEPDGRELAPASPNHQGDATAELAEPAAALADKAFERLRRLLPEVGATWQEATFAMRPVPGDQFPVMGAGKVPGLYIAVMHSGATLAALVGELAAREIAGRGDAPELRPYRPGRFD